MQCDRIKCTAVKHTGLQQYKAYRPTVGLQCSANKDGRAPIVDLLCRALYNVLLLDTLNQQCTHSPKALDAGSANPKLVYYSTFYAATNFKLLVL